MLGGRAVDLLRFQPNALCANGAARRIWRPENPDRGRTERCRTPSSSASPHSRRLRGVLITFCAENVKFGPATQKALSPLGDLVRRAAAADRFTGKNGSTLDIIAPAGLNVPRLVVVGTGKESDLKDRDIIKLGGIARGKVPKSATRGDDLHRICRGGRSRPSRSPNLALGVRLRDYAFDRYKTKRKEDEERADKIEVNFACANPSAAEKAWARTMAIGDGVVMARDLVNEPAERALSRGSSPAAHRA